MKDGLENIDEIVKQAFDGFESNVDPSVWNNIQQSIASGSGGSSTTQVDPSTVAGVVGKSLAVKIIAGVALLGTVATSVYFIPDLFKDEEIAITENIVIDDNLIETVEETNVAIEELEGKEKEIVSGNVVSETVKNNTINDIEPSKIKQTIDTGLEGDSNNETSSDKNAEKSDLSMSNSLASQKNPIIKKTTSKLDNPAGAEKLVKLSVNINVDVIKGKAPLTVQFDAWGDGVEQYIWDFGDGSEEVLGEDSPEHTFINEGTYTVKLIGQGIGGESKATYTRIIVEKDYSSSLEPLQNIFSPNGDGLNDFIKIRGKNINRIQVKITDSKGKVVYFINSMDDKWEGKDQGGSYLIQGQYIMSGMAIGNDGKKHPIKQFVTLRN